MIVTSVAFYAQPVGCDFTFVFALVLGLAETKSHLIYGRKVGYFSKPDFESCLTLITEIWKELNSIISSLSKKP